ncbi:macro domain-containing protein [Bacillus sp. X1(2014)]|uniref:type II toxin-antitoxin system antitoxin DNA ADP-ribosyl glycohydrolase DarG n=1 Tax=Bacillus sp. X1(2014) TaxID=1565991 RepID=UPI0011A059C8|nr:macro domain-containing protein [Bacillus sp. X1(2014)]
MIIYEKGDLFKQLNRVEAIINTVNCVGVMGKGIALEFKNRFPENFQIYKNKCLTKELTIGRSFIYQVPNNEITKFIVNFPTKKHWRNPSKIEYIEEGLDNLTKLITEYNIKSIAMPALGCGNGNLDWNIVKPLIEKKLNHLSNVEIVIYEPSITNEKKTSSTKKKPKLTEDQKKLLLLMNDYNKATKGPLLTYIQTHIISYFLYFKNKNMNFELGDNGPYLNDINKVILRLKEYYIEPIDKSEPNQPTQIKVLSINFPQKKAIMADPDYLLVKSLINGFENYEGLLTLSITHWFQFNERLEPKDLTFKVLGWLKENNHSPDSNLIQKAINRLERIYFEPENLSLF